MVAPKVATLLERGKAVVARFIGPKTTKAEKLKASNSKYSESEIRMSAAKAEKARATATRAAAIAEAKSLLAEKSEKEAKKQIIMAARESNNAQATNKALIKARIAQKARESARVAAMDAAKAEKVAAQAEATAVIKAAKPKPNSAVPAFQIHPPTHPCSSPLQQPAAQEHQKKAKSDRVQIKEAKNEEDEVKAATGTTSEAGALKVKPATASSESKVITERTHPFIMCTLLDAVYNNNSSGSKNEARELKKENTKAEKDLGNAVTANEASKTKYSDVEILKVMTTKTEDMLRFNRCIANFGKTVLHREDMVTLNLRSGASEYPVQLQQEKSSEEISLDGSLAGSPPPNELQQGEGENLGSHLHFLVVGTMLNLLDKMPFTKSPAPTITTTNPYLEGNILHQIVKFEGTQDEVDAFCKYVEKTIQREALDVMVQPVDTQEYLHYCEEIVIPNALPFGRSVSLLSEHSSINSSKTDSQSVSTCSASSSSVSSSNSNVQHTDSLHDSTNSGGSSSVFSGVQTVATSVDESTRGSVQSINTHNKKINHNTELNKQKEEEEEDTVIFNDQYIYFPPLAEDAENKDWYKW